MMKQKNFKEIYDKIYANVGKTMEAKRKGVLIKKILTIVVVLFSLRKLALIAKDASTLVAFLLVLLIIGLILFSIYFIAKISKGYERSFKEEIINEIVRQSNPDLVYKYNSGLSSGDYAASRFDIGWDRFHSEDMIVGKLEDGSSLTMSQVHTEEEHESTDSEGHTTTSYVTTFLGLYGIIKLNNVTNADFAILANSKLSKYNKKRIEMESSQFEKYYDVFVGSKENELRQNAMEILTPETIEQFVIIRNLFKKALEVRIAKDKIYFRISVGDIFEAPTFRSSVNFELLKKYFLIIDVPRMIYEAFIDNIILMYGDSNAREKRNLANMTDDQKEDYLQEKKKLEESTYFSHD